MTSTVVATPSSLGMAFGLVILAGFCPVIGGLVVLFVNRSHTWLLAVALALAAGVMIFISLTEILTIATEELNAAAVGAPAASLSYVFLSFFAGIASCFLIDLVTDSILHLATAKHRRGACASAEAQDPAAPGDIPALSEEGDVESQAKDRRALGSCSNSNVDPETLTPAALVLDNHETAAIYIASAAKDEGYSDLARTGLLVGLALACHNLPEGLVSFIGYLSAPQTGISIAIAIAVHNIPEGMAVAVPVYYATGSKVKALMWTLASGLTEPLGALIGYAVEVTGKRSSLAAGIIMALVAGIMTGVSFRELIPRALQYDPKNKVTTHVIFVGMLIMAVSLVLLQLWA